MYIDLMRLLIPLLFLRFLIIIITQKTAKIKTQTITTTSETTIKITGILLIGVELMPVINY